jgi:hypothetical protein
VSGLDRKELLIRGMWLILLPRTSVKKYYSAETKAIQDSFSPHILECATKIDQEVADASRGAIW